MLLLSAQYCETYGLSLDSASAKSKYRSVVIFLGSSLPNFTSSMVNEGRLSTSIKRIWSLPSVMPGVRPWFHIFLLKFKQ